MPLMFFVAGTLLGPAAGARRYSDLVVRRARRLLVPLWGYGAVVAAAIVVATKPDNSSIDVGRLAVRVATWALPVVDPVDTSWHAGWLSNHLWYLRAYLWIVLLAPVLVGYARRWWAALPVFAVAIVQLEIGARFEVPIVGDGIGRMLVGDAITYGMFAMLGMAYAMRTRPPRPGLLLVGAVAAGGGAIALARFAGLPAGGINGSYGAIALTGLAWLCLAGLFERPLRAVAEVPAVAGLTQAICRRAVTIYLWHPAAIVAALALVDIEGPWRVPAVVAVTAIGTTAAVVVIGWLEDVAAHRRHRVSLPAVRFASAVPVGVAALVVAVPLLVVDVDSAQAETSPRRAGAIPPPSYREALSSSAFSGKAKAPDAPIDLRWGRFPEKRLQAVVDEWLAAHPDSRSVTVGIVVDGKTWTGEAHRDKREAAIRKDERFIAASATKLFTVALVMRQIDAGTIDIDAPMPPIDGVKVPRRAWPITPRQLLTHTSGLPNYTDGRGYDPDRAFSPVDAVNMSLGVKRLFKPGERLYYTNTNYLYLGLLLEQVTGRSYADLVGDMTRELGLRRTSVGGDRPGWVGFSSGGVRSTLDELAVFVDALFTPGKVVSPARHADITTVADHNMALGTWPLCPCGTDATGRKTYSAIGQTVGFGGVAYFPDQMGMAIRIDPPPEHIDMTPFIMAMADPLRAALRG